MHTAGEWEGCTQRYTVHGGLYYPDRQWVNVMSGQNPDFLSETHANIQDRTPYSTLAYLGRYINERFNAIFPRRDFRQVVTPLFTLGISDVENLLGYLQSFTLTDIFESYHSKNKSMLTSMSSSVVPLLKNAKPQRNIVKERYSEFADRMMRAFFDEVPDKRLPV